MAKTKTNVITDPGTLRGRRDRLVGDLRKGRGLSVDFFRRNGWLIIFLTVIILVLIGVRYRTRVYMHEIKTLRQELRNAENEHIEEKALYMSMIRETDMVEMSRRYGLGLTFSDKPPYTLHLDALDSIPPAGN